MQSKTDAAAIAEREAFDAWWCAEESEMLGVYAKQYAWLGWQARAALPTTEATDAIAPTEGAREASGTTPIDKMSTILKSQYIEADEYTDCAVVYRVTFDQLRNLYDLGRAAPSPEAPAVDALTAGAVAEVESRTNGSYHRNYKLHWLRDVEKGTKLYTHPASEPKAKMLSNLLARIHRDGGHYEAEHGTKRAVDDADTKVAKLNALLDSEPKALSLTDEQIKDIAKKHFFNGMPILTCAVEFARALLADRGSEAGNAKS